MQIGTASLPRANFDQHARALAKLEALRLALDECEKLQKIITSADHDKSLAVIRDAQERFRYFDALASGTHADNSIVRADPEPWPEAVTTAALLDEIVSIYQRFVILPDHAAEALALWAIHSYVFEHGEISPILALISPEKRCGKSTTLHLADNLTRRALVTSNVTAAALFRVIEDFKPTLLIDEFDSISNPERKEDLRNILNAGHNRKGRAIRCDGEDNKPKAFCVFSPKMVAAIGDLPETLMDRAIKIQMRRKLPNETVERLRRFDAMETRRRCVRWARDNAASIATAKPILPPELNDRAADNWEPLLAIAELAGEDWRNRARDAALALSLSLCARASCGLAASICSTSDTSLSCRALSAGLEKLICGIGIESSASFLTFGKVSFWSKKVCSQNQPRHFEETIPKINFNEYGVGFVKKML
jgi:hypothetical protein